MKLYKVDYIYFKLSNSLLPPRDPTPEEEAPVQEASYYSVSQAFIQSLVNAGYPRDMAVATWERVFRHYWYTCGMRDIFFCCEECMAWLKRFINPAIAQVHKEPPPGLPPAVLYITAVVGIVLVVVLLVAPEFESAVRWTPPCTLYIATYRERLWWMHLVGVAEKQRAWYESFGYLSPAICAHTYAYPKPPVVTDVLHFWGTMEFRCWQIPWFRVYRAQYANTVFIGYLENMGFNYYKLREPFYDRFAPKGPTSFPYGEYCTVFSPCG